MRDSQWQLLVRQGNTFFKEKQWSVAEGFYSEAYDLLVLKYQKDPLSIETLMAWICVCHNLSSLHEAAGNLELSLKFLTVPHEYLKEVMESDVISEKVKSIAFKGISMTLPPILLFAQQHPICETCKDRYLSLKQLLDQKPKVMH